ncbi:MAG: TonB-dependent receptor [FCB group bacterium]|nr:TonB-dependent receptor [FCB group bacterium]
MSRTKCQAVGVCCANNPGSPAYIICARLVTTVILGIILTSMAVGQTTVKIDGRVFDAVDGRPLAGARIALVDTDFHTFTDPSGSYRFSLIPLGHYRLVVEAEGYKRDQDNEIEVVTDITRRCDIRLNRRVYDLGQTEVRRQMSPVSIQDGKVVNRVDIQRSGADDLARVLESVEGVYVTEGGTAGGIVRVSIRGCDPRHVLVLLDGQRLNSAGSGEANLGSVPLEIVERVEVYRGGQSARFGPDALGGVINIITQIQSGGAEREITGGKYWGSWKSERYKLTITNPVTLKNLESRISYGTKRSNGDFDYDHTISSITGDTTHSGTRYNGGFEDYNYHSTGNYRIGNNTRFYLSGQAYRSRQELPGYASEPDSTAWSKDKRLLAGLRMKHDYSLHNRLDLNVGFTRLEQYFNNVNHSRPAYRYENRYINDILTVKSEHLYRPWPGGAIRGGLEFERNILYHNNLMRPTAAMGRSVRDNTGFVIGGGQNLEPGDFPLPLDAAFNFYLRWDNTEARKDAVSADGPARIDKYQFLSKMINLSLSRGRETMFVLRGSYGNSYSLPSVNALFWMGDIQTVGNPELRPEVSEHSDIGIEVAADLRVKLSAGITYFHSYIKDLIVWHQATRGWKPVNLEAAQITGHEEFVNLGFFDGLFEVRYQNTIMVTRNKNSSLSLYNKELTYRPHYVTNIEGTLNKGRLQAAYRVRLVDIRYNIASNIKWYPAYRIDDFDLKYTTAFKGVDVETRVLVKNLRDMDYTLIGHHPMPGREYGLKISLSYKI